MQIAFEGKLDWEKMDGLIPAVVQHAVSGRVLMLGYMNEEAAAKSLEDGLVCFWSRSKERFWVKGETSGNVLKIEAMEVDCDGDAILIQARPAGPTCHTGTESCFGGRDNITEKLGDVAEGVGKNVAFLSELFDLVKKRFDERPEGSYTSSLFNEGLKLINEKVREEADEVCIAAQSETRERVIEESGDLLYHLFVLWAHEGVSLEEVTGLLEKRHRK